MHTVWHSAENKLHHNSELHWQWWRDWNSWIFSTFTCRTMAHSYSTSYNTATETTFTSSAARDSCNVPSDRFNVQFCVRHGAATGRHNHNNLASDTHPMLFFHMLAPNQPTITGVDLCHKKFGRPRFTETPAIQYQPSVSVHNAPFHSQCHTTHKGTNKTSHSNITLPTNIQYLKIHVRN
jgi:hypothetical protein